MDIYFKPLAQIREAIINILFVEVFIKEFVEVFIKEFIK